MKNVYDVLNYQEANAPNQLQREPMEVNPSAARSLEEGLDKTLMVHIGVPAELRRVSRTTYLIESALSRVQTDCENVKRWRDGKPLERICWHQNLTNLEHCLHQEALRAKTFAPRADELQGCCPQYKKAAAYSQVRPGSEPLPGKTTNSRPK